MNILEKIDELKNLVQGNKIPATGRSMINVENFTEQIDEIKSLIPSEVNESEGIIRQKEAIIKQAEDEAKRIRGYADEEAVKINDNATNKAESLIQNAKEEAYKMITNTEIVIASKNAAQEIEDKANKEAESIIEQGKNEANSIINDAEKMSDDRRKGADNYAREILFSLEEKIADTLGQVRGGIDILDVRKETSVAD
ncbi:MAG: hypothetical protein FI675_02475 [SAR202 cluster bacterium]|nr:hypothetical protein [SAR202 cluster bacterium]|tara:strand:- start:531 stop:1124 length:594 start_codon:yes stop_codon:yes gene_type:complete